jgi:DNA-binding response OmpR family regulator
MTTAIKSAISPSALRKTEPSANAIRFLDEKRASVPASDIPEDFRKLSCFFPVIVLVPKSAVEDEVVQKRLELNKSVTDLTNTGNLRLPLDAAKAWLTDSNAPDTFEFGEIKGCLSTMEIHRNGRAVTLTSKEFKTLVYLIKCGDTRTIRVQGPSITTS